MKRTPSARLDRDIAEALAKEDSKAKLVAEYRDIKRMLSDPISKADTHALRARLVVIDAELAALYVEWASKPRKGGY